MTKFRNVSLLTFIAMAFSVASFAQTDPEAAAEAAADAAADATEEAAAAAEEAAQAAAAAEQAAADAEAAAAAANEAGQAATDTAEEPVAEVAGIELNNNPDAANKAADTVVGGAPQETAEAKAARESAEGMAVGPQETKIIDEDEANFRPTEWVRGESLSLGLAGSYTYNNALFVGAQPGSFLQLGGILEGAMNFRKGGHDIDNYLSFQQGILYSPAMGDFADGDFQKSQDKLVLGTEYRYFLEGVNWFAPYARGEISAQVFPNWFINGVNSDLYQQTDSLNSAGDQYTFEQKAVAAQTKENLTGWFEPIIAEAGVGASFQPKQHRPYFLSHFRLGAKGQSIIGNGGFVQVANPATAITLNDTAATQVTPSAANEFTFNRVRSVNSFGIDGELVANGAFDKRVLWGAKVGAYYPVMIWGSDDVLTPNGVASNVLDVLHVNVDTKVSFKLAEWLSLDWVNRFIRQPFITGEWKANPNDFTNDWQIQSSVLLSMGFNLI